MKSFIAGSRPPALVSPPEPAMNLTPNLTSLLLLIMLVLFLINHRLPFSLSLSPSVPCGPIYKKARAETTVIQGLAPRDRHHCSQNRRKRAGLSVVVGCFYCTTAPADLSRVSSFSFACTTERQWMSCSITFASRFFNIFSVSAMIVLY